MPVRSRTVGGVAIESIEDRVKFLEDRQLEQEQHEEHRQPTWVDRLKGHASTLALLGLWIGVPVAGVAAVLVANFGVDRILAFLS